MYAFHANNRLTIPPLNIHACNTVDIFGLKRTVIRGRTHQLLFSGDLLLRAYVALVQLFC